MKTLIAGAGVVLLAVHSVIAEEPPARDFEGGTVSITLDDVELRDFVRMMTRIADISLSCDPKEPKLDERMSANVQDRPWKPFFCSVLAQHGLLMVEDSPGSGTYSIIRAESADVAARIRASQDAVALADAVLANLDAGDLAAAKARLTKYREHNAAVVQAVQAKQEGGG